MGKKKLIRCAEMLTFPHVFQFPEGMAGTWREKVFGNDNPIVLELACGKGEYAVPHITRNNRAFLGSRGRWLFR